MKNIKAWIIHKLGGYVNADISTPISVSFRTAMGETNICKKVDENKRHSKTNTITAIAFYREGLFVGEVLIEK